MNVLDMFLAGVALVLMAACIGVKAVSTQIIWRLERQLRNAERDLADRKQRLRVAKSQRA